MSPVSFKMTVIHLCWINSDNPPKDIAFVYYVISLLKFVHIKWNIGRIPAYITSLTLERSTFKIYSPLFYDECNL